jgi:hypothetical protein
MTLNFNEVGFYSRFYNRALGMGSGGGAICNGLWLSREFMSHFYSKSNLIIRSNEEQPDHTLTRVIQSLLTVDRYPSGRDTSVGLSLSAMLGTDDLVGTL